MKRDPRVCKYPFLHMKLNESFVLKYQYGLCDNVRSAARRFFKRNKLDQKIITKFNNGYLTVTRVV